MNPFKHIRDFGLLRGAALAAATVISFEAESKLAQLAGVSETVSYAMPISIDCLMIAALRARHKPGITAGSIIMGAANAGSHVLTSETGTVSHDTATMIVAGVSLIPVFVIMVLELWVPAVAVRHAVASETVAPAPAPAMIQAPVSQPVARVEDETVAESHETSDETPDKAHETPAPFDETPVGVALTEDETQQMGRDAAMKVAEDAYAYPGTKTIKEVAEETGYSVAQINRWRKEFKEHGVKVLAVA